jgi:hypothetical protein
MGGVGRFVANNGAVCTAVVRVGVPTLLLGVRDEFVGRAWEPPGRHWDRWPVIGGRDLLAGGTWLAVEPDARRVATVLNGRGRPAPPEGRLSRGDLPLRAASGGIAALLEFLTDQATLARYDPFHLVCADQGGTAMVTWDGVDLSRLDLGPGTHLLTNAGVAYSGGTRTDEPRAAYFGPRFADPQSAQDGHLWSRWRELAGGDGIPADDPRALVVRHRLEDGRTWGSTSVSLVAVAAGGVRYDFQDVPGNAETWHTITAGPDDPVRPDRAVPSDR